MFLDNVWLQDLEIWRSFLGGFSPEHLYCNFFLNACWGYGTREIIKYRSIVLYTVLNFIYLQVASTDVQYCGIDTWFILYWYKLLFLIEQRLVFFVSHENPASNSLSILACALKAWYHTLWLVNEWEIPSSWGHWKVLLCIKGSLKKEGCRLCTIKT